MPWLRLGHNFINVSKICRIQLLAGLNKLVVFGDGERVLGSLEGSPDTIKACYGKMCKAIRAGKSTRSIYSRGDSIMTVVTHCAWCPDPRRPSPECHPNGQCQHVEDLTKRPGRGVVDPDDVVEKIVERICADITGLEAIGDTWDSIDRVTKGEIRRRWKEIVNVALREEPEDDNADASDDD